MFKFFRKIRQKLAYDNNISKYSRYAIGEIVLVVIGILIALQLNNLNDQRKAKKEEVLVLKSLHTEFENNLKTFDSIFKFHERRENYTLQLIQFNEQPIPFNKLDSIIEIIPYNYTSDLSNTIYTSIVTSGKIELISNTQLKHEIAAFEDLLIDFVEEEILIQDFSYNQLTPFINDHIVVRYPFGNRTASELEIDTIEYMKLVNNVHFRNRLIQLKSLCWDITTEGKNVIEAIRNIHQNITTELNLKSN